MVVGCVGWITFDLVNIQLSLVRCERTERIMVLIISMETGECEAVSLGAGDRRQERGPVCSGSLVDPARPSGRYNRDAYQTILQFFED